MNATAQRETKSTAVLVMFMLLPPSLRASMVTRHTQSQERWGSGTFTEQRRIPQRHTPRLHVQYLHNYHLRLDVMII
jgi:hypothetical protein